MPAAGRANPASVERVTHKQMQVSAVLDVVAHGQPVLVVQLVIEFGNSVIVVFCFEDIQVFGSDAHCDLRRIQHSQVVGQEARIRWRFSPALPLVVHEQERSIFANGSAQSPAELILAKRKDLGPRLQKGARVGRTALQVLIDRTVQRIGARLGHNVHDAAERSSIFGAEIVVHHAELAHRFLRRRRALRTGHRIDRIRAIDSYYVA